MSVLHKYIKDGAEAIEEGGEDPWQYKRKARIFFEEVAKYSGLQHLKIS